MLIGLVSDQFVTKTENLKMEGHAIATLMYYSVDFVTTAGKALSEMEKRAFSKPFHFRVISISKMRKVTIWKLYPVEQKTV